MRLSIGYRAFFGLLSLLSPPFVAQAAQPAPVRITQPTPRAVFQRNSRNFALVPIAGSYQGQIKSIEARYVLRDASMSAIGTWSVLAHLPATSTFSGILSVPAGGWYRIEVRTQPVAGAVAQAAVEKVGVGDVFITMGQSNSANHGKPAMRPRSDRVSAWGYSGWQVGADPQPFATGVGGSPWPVLGDYLVAHLGVPVAFISVGYGGTRVAQWQPSGSLYKRLKNALTVVGPRGARAILWHQGEDDVVWGTSADQYAERLKAIINQSRLDAGWPIPWVIAAVSYVPQRGYEAKSAAVREGQRKVIDGMTVFPGPRTDDLIGSTLRYDGVHFTEAGLREHARRWAAVMWNSTPPVPE